MELKTEGPDLEEALADSENRFRCLIEYASDGYLLYDEDGLIVDVNSSACDAYGYARDELAGLSLRDLVEGNSAVGELTEVDEVLCGGAARTVEVTARCRDGRTFPAELRVGLLEGRAQRMFMALVRDVSERERSRERIEYLTGHDELTELPNGRLFSTQTEAAVERAGRPSGRSPSSTSTSTASAWSTRASAAPAATSSCARPRAGCARPRAPWTWSRATRPTSS